MEGNIFLFIIKIICVILSVLNLLLSIFIIYAYKNNKRRYKILYHLNTAKANILIECKSLKAFISFSPEKYTDEDIFDIALNREMKRRFSYEIDLLTYRKQEIKELEQELAELEYKLSCPME